MPEHFDQHVERSVPNYRQGHEIVVMLADFFLRDGGLAYELGCSTGELTRQIAEKNGDRRVSIAGLEIEPSMVEAARRKTAHLPNVEIREADILAADLIVSYYTIQFVRPALRQMLFDKIFASLNWAGASSCLRRCARRTRAFRT